MLIYGISALRAVIEMLGLCLIGQAVLYVLCGALRERNVIYRFFDLLTRPPRQLISWLIRRPLASPATAGFTLLVLFILWIALAWLRNAI